MRPELRCECRSDRDPLGGLRYALAAVVVIAAVLDVVWWVPTYGSGSTRASVEERETRVPVKAMPRCRQ